MGKRRVESIGVADRFDRHVRTEEAVSGPIIPPGEVGSAKLEQAVVVSVLTGAAEHEGALDLCDQCMWGTGSQVERRAGCSNPDVAAVVIDRAGRAAGPLCGERIGRAKHEIPAARAADTRMHLTKPRLTSSELPNVSVILPSPILDCAVRAKNYFLPVTRNVITCAAIHRIATGCRNAQMKYSALKY